MFLDMFLMDNIIINTKTSMVGIKYHGGVAGGGYQYLFCNSYISMSRPYMS